MSGPPPPPRRRKPNPVISTFNDNNNNNNVINNKSPKKQQSLSPSKSLSKDDSNERIQTQEEESLYSDMSTKQIEIPASTIAYNEFIASLNETLEPDQIPETVIGPGVDVRGNMQFERLLRVEGKFQGSIISQGDLVIGRNGCVVANVLNLRTVTVNGGKIIGDINVEKLILRKGSSVNGNIVCKIFISEKFVAIDGTCNIHTLAPEIIDSNGDIIIPVPEIEIGQPSHTQHDKKKGKRKKSTQDIDANENPISIEEQKNKLKAEKLLRREQLKQEDRAENQVEIEPINGSDPVLSDKVPRIESVDNVLSDKPVPKRESINNVPNFNLAPSNAPAVSPRASVSPRLQMKRDTVKIEPLPIELLTSVSSVNQSFAPLAESKESDQTSMEVNSEIKDEVIPVVEEVVQGEVSNIESQIVSEAEQKIETSP
jgi:cytoskeletal protein CcmA (bactofilin family)